MPSPSARLAGGGRRQTERSNFSTMTGAMYAAIAGLRTHMQNLNVIGNNVANVNTTGYKAARSVFRTSIYTTLSGGSDGTATVGGRNPSQIGYGANMSTVDIDMSTGNYNVTGNPTDMMLDGDGFFLVGDKTIAQNFTGEAEDVSRLTSLTLSRTGDFGFKADGYLTDARGNVVYGFLCTGTATEADVAAGKAKKVGDAMFSDQLVPLRQPRVWKDATGAMHVGYPRAGGGVQAGNGAVGDADYVAADPNKAAFDQAVQAAGGNTETEAHLLDYGSYKDKDGNIVESEYSLAYFTNITVDNATGMITATCSDVGNQVITIGCVAVGSVTNPNGVTQIGNTYYQAGEGSGDLVVNTLGGAGENMGIYYANGSLSTAAGNGQHVGSINMAQTAANAIDGNRLRTGGKTSIISGGLEMSKTDLAQEIANMIVTQRGYQANTRIITVTDSMLEELVNMKR